MFSKFRSNFAPFGGEPGETAPAPPSIISRDLRIVGDVHSDGELQIDGVVEGDVRAGTLLVGDTADIHGDVIAESVHVHGRLAGHISAREVSLGETACVTGDITHEDISIQMGAYLDGRCIRAPESVRPAPAAPARLAAAAAAESRAENRAESPPKSPAMIPAGGLTAEAGNEPVLDSEPARKRAAGS
ncbi:MAG: bactofilin family protein [Rhodospirillales bacterium]